LSLVSIAIPCRSLTDYARNAVRVSLDSGQDTEVVLSLNDPSVGPEELSQWGHETAGDDARFRIVQPPRLLSMTENFRFVFSRLQGDWQTVIGSDDGVLPTLQQALRFADQHFPEVSFVTFPREHSEPDHGPVADGEGSSWARTTSSTP
jgi:hypothetical protein